MNGFILTFEIEEGTVTCFFPTKRRVMSAASYWACEHGASEMAIFPGTQEDVQL